MKRQPTRNNQPTAGGKGLQNPSQLLLRHIDDIQGSSILVVGHPDDEFGLLLQEHLPKTPVTLFNFDYSAHLMMRQRFASAGLQTGRIVFGPWYTPQGKQHDAALVYLPKSRGLIEMTLSMIADAVQPNAIVFLVGENNAGIRSSKSALESIIGEVTSSDAARHCVLYRAIRGTHPPQQIELDDWIESFSVEVRGLKLEIKSLPGVFSHGRLDAGTRFFLENLEIPPDARVLDFGCGAGVIGLTVKRLWPNTEIDMVDSNALAIESAHRTMTTNNFPGDRIWPSDVFSDVKGSYTRIVSNPPFHTGVQTDYRVVEEFIKDAAKHLEKNGALTIVANRFLQYPTVIERNLGRCVVVAENNGYRVYEGVRT